MTNQQQYYLISHNPMGFNMHSKQIYSINAVCERPKRLDMIYSVKMFLKSLIDTQNSDKDWFPTRSLSFKEIPSRI